MSTASVGRVTVERFAPYGAADLKASYIAVVSVLPVSYWPFAAFHW
ncbi:hypothetical protein SCYAM73S_08158 [Streptomyces cyaneofuscatus]